MFATWNECRDGKPPIGRGRYSIPGEGQKRGLELGNPKPPILKVPFPDGRARQCRKPFCHQITFEAQSASDVRGALDLSEADAAVFTSAKTASAVEGGSAERLTSASTKTCVRL